MRWGRARSGRRPDGEPAAVPLHRAGSVLAAATLFANVLGYASVLVLSRALGPDDYGAIAALLGLTVIGGVPALAVQLVTARLATASGATPKVAGLAAAVAVRLGAALATAALVAAPALTWFLHLDGWLPAVLLAAVLFPTPLTSAAQGLLLGRERFAALSGVYAWAAVLRFGAGATAAVLGWGVSGVMAATAAAATASLLVALRVQPMPLRSVQAPVDRQEPAAGSPALPGPGRLVRQVASSTVSTAGLMSMVTVDVLLARHFLSARDSGFYAVGSLFAKAAFWGPQFLATLLYPRMASTRHRDVAVARGVIVTSATGALAVTGAALFGLPAVEVAGGQAYRALAGDVWLFAALGGVLAVVQVLVYARLAVADGRLGVAAWVATAVACLLVATVGHGSVTSVVVSVLLSAVGLAVAGLMLERRAVAPRTIRGAVRRRPRDRAGS